MTTKIKILMLIIVVTGVALVLVAGIRQKQNTNNISTGTATDDISPAARKSLESLVNYADQLPDIAADLKQNFFILWYRKNVNGNLKPYVGVATGTEKNGFRLVREVPLTGVFDALMLVYFKDFNDDHLDDVYVLFTTNLSSTAYDGAVLIQNKPGEFVVAAQDPPGLFKYTSGPGVPPKFEDIDGDGSLEITTVDIQGLDTPKFSKTMRIAKLKGNTFYLWKETPMKK